MAHILDLIILSGVFLLILSAALLPLVIATDSGEEDLPGWAIWSILPIVPAFVVASFAYYVALWRWRGQTVGQMVLGLRVVTREGHPPGFGRLTLRYVGLAIPSLLVFLALLAVYAAVALLDFSLEDARRFAVVFGISAGIVAVAALSALTALFNGERRALHDLMAGTVVERVEGSG